MDTLAELREQYRARLDEMEALIALAEGEGRDLTEAEQEQYDGWDAELVSLRGRIERLEALEEARNKAPEAPRSNPRNAPQVEARDYDETDFRSLADFVQSVVFRRNDQRLQGLYVDAERREGDPPYAGLEMQTPSAGGYLIPEQFASGLLEFTAQDAIVRPRATVIPPGTAPDAKIHLPMLDQSGTKGVYSGVQVAWIGEGDFKPETAPSFDQISLEPYEVAAHTPITDKALRNAPELELIVRRLLTSGITVAEDVAFLTGDGTAKPTGFIGHSSAVKVNRTTANDVTYADLVEMLSRMVYGGTPVWLVTQRMLPKLMHLADAEGRMIWQPNAREGVPGTIFGYPVIYSNRLPAIGALGDVSFVDLNYYLIKDGTGLMIAASEHVQFLNNRTVIKAFKLVDGRPWPKTPLQDENGETVSPFVVLDVPSGGGGD